MFACLSDLCLLAFLAPDEDDPNMIVKISKPCKWYRAILSAVHKSWKEHHNT